MLKSLKNTQRRKCSAFACEMFSPTGFFGICEIPHRMIEKKITITNRLGLHARAAAKVVRTAANFKSDITLRRIENGSAIDAKSILSILTLAAAKDSVLEIKAVGEDETEAIDALETLFRDKFGEEL